MKKILKLTPITITITIVIICIGILAYYIGISFFDMVELKAIDLRFKYRGNISHSNEIVLAVIDEKSLANEGKWIWPRTKIADLINKISNAGSKIIAFDIGFLEPDEKSLIKTIEKIEVPVSEFCSQNDKIKNYINELKAESDYDALLAKAIKKSSAKVILGYFFRFDKEKIQGLTDKIIREYQENILSSRYMFVRYTSAEAQNNKIFEANVPQPNIKKLSEQTDFSGFFNMIPDNDGIVRRVHTVISFREILYAPLSIMIASSYLDAQPSINVADYGIESLKIGKLSIPTDEMGRLLVNYRGTAFPHISVTDILNGKISNDILKDKIVIVGATATGIYDMRATPFDSVFPGVEIHANIVDSILNKDFLYQPNWTAIFNILFIIISGSLLCFILPRTSIIIGVIFTSFLFLGYIFLCQLLFIKKGWILNLVYPLLVMTVNYLCITVYQYLIESKDKRFIKKAFSTYLAPSVVNQLINSPEKLVLGGERRKITAFFSDVQGFTSISEKLSPEELVELLNDFLTEMTDIILSYKGTVDKFEGDAIIAFFGAPNDIENQAEIACMACIDMQKKLIFLREKWKAEKKPELKMRIGLCTGPAVIGNMGSKSRMNYTMMGDTVNTAARLEGVNKVYGTYLMVGDITYKEASISGNILGRELDSIKVVGKSEAVSVYQIIGYKKDCNENTLKMINYYEKGLYEYRHQNWDNAVTNFKEALKFVPDDPPSKMMIKRCDEFKLNPVKEWNGAYSMKTK